MDRCVPAFLLAENSWRRTNHYIIFGFLGLCWSLYTILNGNVDTLSNVYTVSFLGVMGLFSIGNMILKYKRNDLPRSVRATWPTVIAGFALVAYAFAGTVVLNPSILGVWLLYFSGTALLVGSMFFRVHFLKFGHYFCRSARKAIGADDNSETLQGIAETIQAIRRQPIAFFAKRPTASVINKAILYVRQNEVGLFSTHKFICILDIFALFSFLFARHLSSFSPLSCASFLPAIHRTVRGFASCTATFRMRRCPSFNASSLFSTSAIRKSRLISCARTASLSQTWSIVSVPS
jgi:hypothetical protein